MNQKYQEFLTTKITRSQASGFDVPGDALNPMFFPFQKHIVQTALKAGRYAIFSDCGTGKGPMQLEWSRLAAQHTHLPALILTPLAVTGQLIQEGVKFGIECVRYTGQSAPGVYITNYEQLPNLNPEMFGSVALDEASILKNYTGKYRQMLTAAFTHIPYLSCWTATPSPNDLNELGNQAEFLRVMDNTDMRTRWFVRDEGMNNYRLKAHARGDFFSWVASWATMFTTPADIGFPMKGYDLPPLNLHECVIQTARRDNGKLFNETAVSATTFNKELRLTIIERLEQAAQLVNESVEPFIVWIEHDAEGIALRKLIPEAVEVSGKDKLEVKEARLLGFAKGEFRVLITKPKIAQFGLNYQHCRHQVFTSMSFSYEKQYQAIRRSYRFGQTQEVNIYLITTDTMRNVIESIHRKEAQFLAMRREMITAMTNTTTYGLRDNYERAEYKSDWAHLIKGDSAVELESVPDNSVDFMVFSPPFSTLFTYSDYTADMGNNANDDAFFEQYSFLLRLLYRKLKPGRLMACHTKDLARYKNSSGFSGLYDFTGAHHRAVEAEGFKYHSKVTIWTDPVLEMQRTKTQRLLYKTLTSDSTYSGTGMAEYVTIFRKWEGNEEEWKPVVNLTKQNFPLEVWQQWASPVWMNIRRTDVLNAKAGKGRNDEKHIAPLQLSVIHRLINLYTNEGETVLTPFLGIGSEAYVAVKNRRKAIGCELKDEYYAEAIKNIQAAETRQTQGMLFEFSPHTTDVAAAA